VQKDDAAFSTNATSTKTLTDLKLVTDDETMHNARFFFKHEYLRRCTMHDSSSSMSTWGSWEYWPWGIFTKHRRIVRLRQHGFGHHVNKNLVSIYQTPSLPADFLAGLISSRTRLLIEDHDVTFCENQRENLPLPKNELSCVSEMISFFYIVKTKRWYKMLTQKNLQNCGSDDEDCQQQE